MKSVETIVQNTLHDDESQNAKGVYVGSTEQDLTYATPPAYARIIADLIASMKPSSVLEFGCCAGRNLNLLSQRLQSVKLTGVDVNPYAIEQGKALHNLDLILGDDTWLENQESDSHDVCFTVSVIDHIPYPEYALRHLLRISKNYLVLFELSHVRLGKATHNIFIDDDNASLRPIYRYSYTHDYRHECESKFGAHCILDAKLPIGADNLLDLYRLYVFSKAPRHLSETAIQSVLFEPLR